MRDAFHQAAITDEGVGMVIDDRMSGPVEALRQQPFGEGHADRVGQTLPERSGGGFDAGRHAELGVPGCLRMQLPEALQVGNRQIVARQMQQGVEQHRSVTVGDDEPVPVRPARIGRIVLEVASPQHLGDVGHAQRHPGVTGVRHLDGIDGEETQCVGTAPAELAGFGGQDDLLLRPGHERALTRLAVSDAGACGP
ncbi:MAG: hypothetical protein AW08_03195 [Candidatus Accumulibacter adjunctus]|uniref:Uncharacterized protein n=1 Tax=Candidatus Accumulibacter adjunctus TaxID=1454001 RepID=A0A011M6Y7_9PROT|nr:MAG: hypothetical protein AW08_03195 [Candidatus Accumulibacter adjunctus]